VGIRKTIRKNPRSESDLGGGEKLTWLIEGRGWGDGLWGKFSFSEIEGKKGAKMGESLEEWGEGRW